MAWAPIASQAELRAPGRIAELEAEYGERRGATLLDEAQRLVERAGR